MTGQGQVSSEGWVTCEHGRHRRNLCIKCDQEGRSPSCAACDTRLAVVAVHRLGDVALHVTRTEPWGEDARCLECVLDTVTRLVVPS